MSEDIHEKLDELEKEIEKAKEEKSKLTGMLETLLEQMEERFGISSVKEATDLLNEIKEKMGNLDTQLNEKYDKLKESFEW